MQQDNDFKLSATDPQFSLCARRALPLDGVRVAVAAADVRDWVILLEAAGADLLELEEGADFLLCSATEHSKESFEMCKKAFNLGIQLVSFTWLFECLVLQCMRQPDSRHMFKVEYLDTQHCTPTQLPRTASKPDSNFERNLYRQITPYIPY